MKLSFYDSEEDEDDDDEEELEDELTLLFFSTWGFTTFLGLTGILALGFSNNFGLDDWLTGGFMGLKSIPFSFLSIFCAFASTFDVLGLWTSLSGFFFGTGSYFAKGSIILGIYFAVVLVTVIGISSFFYYFLNDRFIPASTALFYLRTCAGSVLSSFNFW